jgi:hypothetical protein
MSAVLSRRLMRLAARLLVGMVLFTQALVIAHACTPAERSASFTSLGSGHGSDCHEQKSPDLGSCLAHCSTADQSLDTPQVTVPSMPVTPLLTVPLAADRGPANAYLDAATASGADPPIAIRFQVFRI